MAKISWKILVPSFYILLTIGYFAITSFYILRTVPQDFVWLIPGRTHIDLIITFIVVPIIMCFLLPFSYLFTFLNFKITKLFQVHYEYYYIDLKQKPFPARHLFQRALIPVLVAIAISQLVNSVPFFTYYITREVVSSIIFLAILITPIVCILFIPLWIYKDAGIIKVRKKSDKRIPPDIHPYGKIQYQSYRGFAGITTPITYFIIIFPNLQSANYVSLIVLLFPFFLIGLYMPLLILYEARVEKISEKIVRKLNLPPLQIENIDKNIF
mgnify:CR=1 FL=1